MSSDTRTHSMHFHFLSLNMVSTVWRRQSQSMTGPTIHQCKNNLRKLCAISGFWRIGPHILATTAAACHCTSSSTSPSDWPRLDRLISRGSRSNGSRTCSHVLHLPRVRLYVRFPRTNGGETKTCHI